MKNIKTYTQTLNEAEGQGELNRRLMAAAEKGNTDVVKDLLDKGAQVDARTYRGYTPLRHAAFNGYTDTARLLLDRGAQVDSVDVNGHTPLRSAVINRRADVPKLLILRGADPLNAFDSPEEIIKFFNGDIDWMPEGPTKTKLKRMQRGKSAFGM